MKGFLLKVGFVLCLSISMLGWTLEAHSLTLNVPTLDYPNIQTAIGLATSGQDTVLVHDGIYSENISFMGKNITVMSENGPDVTTINGATYPVSDNGSVVKFAGGETAAAVLSGFTLTGGTGTLYSGYYYGGGIFCAMTTCSPTITNCIITNNTAAGGGGGICCGGLTTISNCTVTSNTAGSGGGIRAGGETTISNCTISNNTTGGGGGGITCQFSSGDGVKIINCIIAGNTTDWQYGGGGIWTNSAGGGSPVEITNCIISGNTAGIGGGIFSDHYALLSITNCTIAGNSAIYTDPAWQGGGIYCRQTSWPQVVNTILWDNSPQQIQLNESDIIVIYSDVEGGWAGDGNINNNPLFAGRGYRIRSNSPCIDTGTSDTTTYPNIPNKDIDLDDRPQGSGIDMGADEYRQGQGNGGNFPGILNLLLGN